MKRTKPKAREMLPRSSKNIATQTESFDHFIMVARLEEQVKTLQLEINTLRKHVEISNESPLTSQATPKMNNEKSSCGCKGNCSSRICGCVKRNNQCNPSCKCDDKMCQNHKLECNQENKENVNRTDKTPKKQNTKKIDITRRNNKGLFSPDTSDFSKVFEEIQLNDIGFSCNEKNTDIRNLQTNLYDVNDADLEKRKEKKRNNKEQQESIQKEMFNPMKPRHQLSRTPPKKLEKSEVENIIQPQLQSKSTRKMMIVSYLNTQDVEEEKIDWEEHTAQLIPCKKCKRTFMPDRIQKHEACCKKI